MENRFKNRITSMIRASLGSCRARYISDVIEKAVFVPQQSYHHLNNTTQVHLDDLHQHPNTPLQYFPSLCGPKCPDSSSTQFINPVHKKATRSRSRFRYPPLIPADNAGGHSCPPVSPASLSAKNHILYNMDYEYYYGSSFRESEKHEKKKKKKKNRTLVEEEEKKNKKKSVSSHSSNKNEKKNPSLSSLSSLDSSQYFSGRINIRSHNWFSSEGDEDLEEEEEETLFTSRSTTFSSDSSRTSKRHRTHRRKTRKGAGSGGGGGSSRVLPLKEVTGKVKDSVAVVKSSSDPYSDFRTSMLEMILEKQIFGAKELEQLLQCFLSLNSQHHHKVIVEVFTEIWETLFSSWS